MRKYIGFVSAILILVVGFGVSVQASVLITDSKEMQYGGYLYATVFKDGVNGWATATNQGTTSDQYDIEGRLYKNTQHWYDKKFEIYHPYSGNYNISDNWYTVGSADILYSTITGSGALLETKTASCNTNQ